MQRLAKIAAQWRFLLAFRFMGICHRSIVTRFSQSYGNGLSIRVSCHNIFSSVISTIAVLMALALCLFFYPDSAQAQGEHVLVASASSKENIPHIIRYQIVTGAHPIPKFRNRYIREQYELIMKKGMREKCERLSREASNLQKKIMKFVNGKLNPKFDEWKGYRDETAKLAMAYALTGKNLEKSPEFKQRLKIQKRLRKQWDDLYRKYLELQTEYEAKRQAADECWKDALRQAEAQYRTVERKKSKDFSISKEDLTIGGLKGCPKCRDAINNARKAEEAYADAKGSWNVEQLKESIRKAELLLQSGLMWSDIEKAGWKNSRKNIMNRRQQLKENKALEKKIQKWRNVLKKIEKARKEMEKAESQAKDCIKKHCKKKPEGHKKKKEDVTPLFDWGPAGTLGPEDIVPKGKRPELLPKGHKLKFKVSREKKKEDEVVKLIQVIPGSGNNPFDTRDPMAGGDTTGKAVTRPPTDPPPT